LIKIRDTTALLEKAYQDEQRKTIEEFLDFFLGEKKENEKDWPTLSLLGISREELIDEFFMNRK